MAAGDGEEGVVSGRGWELEGPGEEAAGEACSACLLQMCGPRAGTLVPHHRRQGRDHPHCRQAAPPGQRDQWWWHRPALLPYPCPTARRPEKSAAHTADPHPPIPTTHPPPTHPPNQPSPQQITHHHHQLHHHACPASTTAPTHTFQRLYELLVGGVARAAHQLECRAEHSVPRPALQLLRALPRQRKRAQLRHRGVWPGGGQLG